MSEKKTSYAYDLTQPVVLSHPTLVTPKAFMEKGKPKGDPVYSCDLVFEPDSEELAALKALAVKAVKERAPGVSLSNFVFPFKDGSKLADARAAVCAEKGRNNDGEFQRGKVVLKTKSKYPPNLAGIENGKVVDYVTDEAKIRAEPKFYFGVQVLATVAFIAYPPIGENKGFVSAYVQCVFSTGKGQKLTANIKGAAERFKGYVGSISADDPTEGLDSVLDDEIPF